MYMIVGLGNPGRKYINTRHNIGFDVVDAFCAKNNIKFKSSKLRAVKAVEEIIRTDARTAMQMYNG